MAELIVVVDLVAVAEVSVVGQGVDEPLTLKGPFTHWDVS